MLITENELAAKLKVSRNTLQAWRKYGMPFLKVEKAIRYDWAKVLEWIESRSK